MSEQGPKPTRRDLLQMIGLAGGSAAVHETLVALGLMRHPNAWAGPPRCEPQRGKGRHVLILGAGFGGLATAYWLSQFGYRCTVLEALDRVGGRSQTARTGDKVFEESDQQGPTVQECNFDDDPRLYINLGPGRIPYHHRRVIDLCQALDVPLEVYVHTSDFNLHRMADGKIPMDRALERRRIANDTQGYIAELLAKAVNQHALDHELLEGDRDRLLELLRKFGDLNSRFRYQGSTRAGCQRLPLDVKNGCGSRVLDALKPLELEVLLDSAFWDPCMVAAPVPPGEVCRPERLTMGFYQVEEDLWQTTSFQPVGGMDRIVMAMRDAILALGGTIVYHAEVRKVTLTDDGRQVRVHYWDQKKKESVEMDAALCVSNIPLTVLQRSRIDLPQLSPETRGAIARAEFSDACKVGWQAERRFWEEQGIYGGISWVQHEITQMWYPSNDYLSEKGTLTGAYNYSATASRFGKLSLAERLETAREGGAMLHPNAFSDESVVPTERGISIAWQNVPTQRGCSANWHNNERQDELDYETLLVPDQGMNQRFFFVGDQVSTLPGWQEGAMMSAEHVVDQITLGTDLDLETIRREVTRAPTSLQVMG